MFKNLFKYIVDFGSPGVVGSKPCPVRPPGLRVNKKKYPEIKPGDVWYRSWQNDPWDGIHENTATVTDVKLHTDGVLWVKYIENKETRGTENIVIQTIKDFNWYFPKKK